MTGGTRRELEGGRGSTLLSPRSSPALGPGHSSSGFLEGFKVKGTLGLFTLSFPWLTAQTLSTQLSQLRTLSSA